jgi:hypothetical protein
MSALRQPACAHAADTKRAASCISMPAAQVHGGSTQIKEEVRPEVSHNERQRDLPTGYRVVRVRFKDGRPEGSYENFVTGFWVSGQHRVEVWGRPAALAVMKDGLLIADDTCGWDDLARLLHPAKGPGI